MNAPHNTKEPGREQKKTAAGESLLILVPAGHFINIVGDFSVVLNWRIRMRVRPMRRIRTDDFDAVKILPAATS
jgi:hypothetical protein